MNTKWQIAEPDPESVKSLSEALRCELITAATLCNRGLCSPQAALTFLKASLRHMRDPLTLRDINTAADRIYHALHQHEKILIFGDYDVDGISATTLLVEFFRALGADVSYFIPHRLEDGYGLQAKHILQVARPDHIDLVITADCGSTSHEALQAANQCGIDVIITDHHHTVDPPPAALAFINPKRHDCNAAMEHLAGVGVAFALIISLRKYLRKKSFWQNRPEPNLKRFCDLVCLGTIADMVPLRAENRIFAKIGLDLLGSGQRCGLTALCETSAISATTLNADDVAYRIAPRLNAAGRLAHASAAVELLTAKSMETARELAATLNQLNRQRQEMEQQLMTEVASEIDQNPQALNRPAIILAHQGWHEGILGIVASRITERYGRPAILLTRKEQFATGSGRSLPGLNLFEALGQCGDLLEKFGGHALAAGLTLRVDNLDRFKRQFDEILRDRIPAEGLSVVRDIDAVIDFADISEKLVDELESMMPFGEGNPEPLFLARDIRVLSSKIVGDHHRQMLLQQRAQTSAKPVSAIFFRVDAASAAKEHFYQLIFKIRWNRWNGKRRLQLIIESA